MLRIAVTNSAQNSQLDHPAGPLEFGRGPQRYLPRCIIQDNFVSRDQLRVEELPDGRVRLYNLSSKSEVGFPDGTCIEPGQITERNLPLQLIVGETILDISLGDKGAAAARPATPPPARPAAGIAETQPLEGMQSALRSRQGQMPDPASLPFGAAHLEMTPGQQLVASGYHSIQPVRADEVLKRAPALGDLNKAPPPDTLTQWMEMILALQRSDAGPPEFYAKTARAVIDMVGLDVGLVLLRGERAWKVVARAASDDDEGGNKPAAGREFSQTVLQHVLTEKRTFFQDITQLQSQESLRSIDAVVVSPIFGLRDEVVGALYGLRRSGGKLALCKIRPLEAQLVQLLAAAVGAYQARTTATRTRTQFEQFFSPELVRALEKDPGLLEGRSREVTILMSDLRGFSTLSEQLGPEETCRLVRDVMERLSERIVEHGGVIVSYLGDGILAMWNAPALQENHARQACQAALAMLEEMPGLNATWQPIVGQPLAIGIGVNTGPAQVGNTGSSRKFMYGPLGNTVNLASRVEGATKYLKVPVLITGSTRAQIGDAFVTRRLCQVRVVGIHSAVDLHELHEPNPSKDWLACRDKYETALGLYEKGEWLKACQLLLPLLERGEDSGIFDHPTLKLMNRAWACLESPPDPFDPVMELSSK